MRSSVQFKMVFMRSEKSIIIRFALLPLVSAALCTFLLPLIARGGSHKLPWTYSRLIPSTQTCNQLAKCLLTSIYSYQELQKPALVFFAAAASFGRKLLDSFASLLSRSFSFGGTTTTTTTTSTRITRKLFYNSDDSNDNE